MVSSSTSVATKAVSRTVSEINQLIGQKSPNFITPFYSVPPLGEAVGVNFVFFVFFIEV